MSLSPLCLTTYLPMHGRENSRDSVARSAPLPTARVTTICCLHLSSADVLLSELEPLEAERVGAA